MLFIFTTGGEDNQEPRRGCPLSAGAAHTHALQRRAASSAAQPNMLQHLPKKSENECKLRLFYAPRHLCLTLVITIGGGGGGGGGGRRRRSIRHLPAEKSERRTPSCVSTSLQDRFYVKPQGASCQSHGNR